MSSFQHENCSQCYKSEYQCVETFKDVLSQRILEMEVLSKRQIHRFLNFYLGRKKDIAKDLFSLYEQHALMICRYLSEELRNPTFRGFGLFYAAPLNLKAEYLSGYYVDEGRKGMEILNKIITLKNGPFTLFSASVENQFEIDLTGDTDLDSLVEQFKERIPTQASEIHQPMILLFAVLDKINQSNIKTTPRLVVPFMNWRTVEEYTTYLNPLYTSTILTIIFLQATDQEVCLHL
jgi:hypothetical protein